MFEKQVLWMELDNPCRPEAMNLILQIFATQLENLVFQITIYTYISIQIVFFSMTQDIKKGLFSIE